MSGPFVIRSMSTTDAHNARGVQQKVIPYHVYLMRPEKRTGAWWTSSLLRDDLALFDTEAEAQAELDRLFADKGCGKPEVAPIDADKLGLPPFWENRKNERN